MGIVATLLTQLVPRKGLQSIVALGDMGNGVVNRGIVQVRAVQCRVVDIVVVVVVMVVVSVAVCTVGFGSDRRGGFHTCIVRVVVLAGTRDVAVVGRQSKAWGLVKPGHDKE